MNHTRYCHPAGVAAIRRQGADVPVRLDTSVPLFGPDGQRFPLLSEVRKLPTAGTMGQWPVWMHDQDQAVAGRLCGVRKSAQAIASAQRKIDRREQKDHRRARRKRANTPLM